MRKRKEDVCISPEDEQEIKKAATRVFNLEEGKVVLVDFGEVVETGARLVIRSDYECADKGTDTCEDCRLRFSCYLNQYLIIKAEDLHLDLDRTINEIVKDYVESAKPESTK